MDDLNFDDSIAEALESVESKELEGAETEQPETTEHAESAQPEGEGQPEQTEDTDQGESEEAKPADEAQPLEPHSRWSAEEKERFAALPREAQEFVLKRESDVNTLLTQKTQEIADVKRGFDSLQGIYAQYRHNYASDADFTQAISGRVAQLEQLSSQAERDPVGFIKYLAEQRGIDLQQQFGGEGEYTDPDIAALKSEITQLKQLVSHQQQQAQQSELNKNQSLVQSFKQNTQEYPHFETLESQIAALIPAIKSANPGASNESVIKEAYEKATWADPVVREKLLIEQKKTEEAKRIEDQKAAAARANKAKQVNVRTSSSNFNGEAPKTYGNLDEALNATALEVVERMGAA